MSVGMGTGAVKHFLVHDLNSDVHARESSCNVVGVKRVSDVR